MTSKQLQVAVELYQCNWSGAKIAAHLNIPISTIYTNLNKAGIQMRKRGQREGMGDRLDYNEVTKTVLLYRNGYSTTEVGHMLGITHHTVAYRLKQAGEPMRARGQSSHLRWQRRPKVRRAQ